MRFLFRVAFWLSIVVLLLPSDPERGTDAPSVTFMEVLGAARAAVTDLSQFCVRNPELCETGGAVAQVIADKARYGIEQLQAYLEAHTAVENTLTPADAATPWQPPAANQVANAR